ncbi:hypothetical protein HPB49_024796 [Dermacentor silvarum]|uniref:Uncharacterized protein n=1 Tax=Dermacentor silvarum TaxID=543639 RepID=A0ACB8DHG7_DERSI|nr:hypothetical protein HPB49_024796 [Dermacentor silvarum]
MAKNFQSMQRKPSKLKSSSAVSFQKANNLVTLSLKVNKWKDNHHQVFFAAKTHKLQCPMRAIVTEADTWQKLVGQYLQHHLESLTVQGPYGVVNATASS